MSPNPLASGLDIPQCTSITRCLSTLPGNVTYQAAELIGMEVVINPFLPVSEAILYLSALFCVCFPELGWR